jgi:uncharacterized oxidoreductase
MPSIRADAMIELVRDIFLGAGCSRQESARIARSLVGANLTGHDSHGVVRVPRYIDWKEQGAVLADQVVGIVTETPVLAVVDGRYGFGQTVAPQAVEIGVGKCKTLGLSTVALRNAGHLGRVGEWAEMAAGEGLVSIHYVSAPQSVMVAPYGGIDRRFSTAPHAIGVPMQGREPLILDFATSIVAEGKILVASQGGTPVPEGALIQADGTLSSDPHVLYGDYTPTGPRNNKSGPGAIRAFGDHKGSGLAFMCEILGGSLTGTGAADPNRARWANGMLSFYVDPSRLDTDAFFPADVARYVAFVKSSRPAVPASEVLVPGEPEVRARHRRRNDGIPLSDDAWMAIAATAAKVGLDEARIAAVLRLADDAPEEAEQERRS